MDLAGQDAVRRNGRFGSLEVETLVVEALRLQIPPDEPTSDRHLVDRQLRRATLGRDSIAIEFSSNSEEPEPVTDPQVVTVPFSCAAPPRKGIAHEPSIADRLDDASRAALLSAIARSQRGIDTLLAKPSQSFGTIAEAEKLAERSLPGPAGFFYPHASFRRSSRAARQPASPHRLSLATRRWLGRSKRALSKPAETRLAGRRSVCRGARSLDTRCRRLGAGEGDGGSMG